MSSKPGSQVFPFQIDKYKDQLPRWKLGNKSLNWDFIAKPSILRHLRVSKCNEQIPSTYQKEKLASHPPMYKKLFTFLVPFKFEWTIKYYQVFEEILSQGREGDQDKQNTWP